MHNDDIHDKLHVSSLFGNSARGGCRRVGTNPFLEKSEGLKTLLPCSSWLISHIAIKLLCKKVLKDVGKVSAWMLQNTALLIKPVKTLEMH